MRLVRAVIPTAVALIGLAACGSGTPSDTGSLQPVDAPASSRAATKTPAPAPAPTGSARLPRTAPTYAYPVGGTTDYHRTHATYPATDIFAGCGNVVRAPTAGIVLELSRTDPFRTEAPDGATKGGLFVSIRGIDKVRYYLAHLATVQAGLRAGDLVRTGQLIGTVGRTGNANNVCHVHFAISPPCRGIGDWWIRRGVVYPWPYLDAWRAGVHRSPTAAVMAWQGAHGCPGPP